MRVDPGITYDGFRQVQTGVNSAVPPSLLPDGQFAWSVNGTFRNYVPQTRPGMIKHPLNFNNASGIVDTSLRTNFEDYIFQGAAGFERLGQLIVSIGGLLFRIDVDSWQVQDISTASPTNNPQLYRAWFCEAEDFMIVQDGQDAPIIFDGGSSRRSDTFGIAGVKEVPVGQAMVYSQGRLVVALPDGRQFVVGDIVGGPTGTPAYNYRDAILKFTENDVVNEGGAFSLPMTAGFLTAFRPVAQVDTSTGQGPTQVFTTAATFSLNTPVNRATWKDLAFPIGTVSNPQGGSMSDRATVNVNGDLWTRAVDGVRSFVVARRDFGTWVNTPQSREEDRAIAGDEQALLGYSSAVLFDNRLLTTIQPYRNFQHGVVHRGLAVLDFAPVAFIGQNSRPVWEGMWTGLQILQILTCNIRNTERCFIFALNSDNEIELWELTKNRTHDYDGAQDVPIGWTSESNNFKFQDIGKDLKRLRKGYVWLSDIAGTVNIAAFYRTNEDPCWHSWHEWETCATVETCGSGNCLTPLNLHPQYRRPYNLPEPVTAFDTTINVPDSVGEEFQVRFEITGHCQIRKLLIGASEEQQDVNSLCPADEACREAQCCPVSDLLYSIED